MAQGVVGGITSWAWEYRGRYHDGTLPLWLAEDEVRHSFSPLERVSRYVGSTIWPRQNENAFRSTHERRARTSVSGESLLTLPDWYGQMLSTRGQRVLESGAPGWGLGGAYATRSHSRDGASDS